jgi:hypothetical protein
VGRNREEAPAFAVAKADVLGPAKKRLFFASILRGNTRRIEAKGTAERHQEESSRQLKVLEAL